MKILLQTLSDGLRTALLRAPRGHAFSRGPSLFVALVAVYLATSLAIDFIDAGPPRAFAVAGVPTVLTDCLLAYVAGWLFALLAGRRELATGVASSVLAATIMAGTVVLWPLRHLVDYLHGQAGGLWWLLPALAGQFWWLFVLLVLAHALMPRRFGRSVGAALLGFAASGAVWWWLPSTPLVDTAALQAVAQEPAADESAPPSSAASAEPAEDEAPAAPGFDAEAAIYAQGALLDAELARLAPRTPGKTNLYVVAFAGDGAEDLFRNEVEYVRELFERRFDATGHVAVLVNNPATVTRQPLATWTSLQRTLQAIATRMDPAQDIVLVYLTSHGAPEHELLVDLDPLPLVQITPEDLADAFKTTPAMRWKVVIVNACYSGGFIDVLRDDSTLVMTSARSDRTSFGCGSAADITWFGQALLVDALNRTTSLVEAFGLARDWVAQRENAEPDADGKVEHSEPQIASTPSIEARLARWSAALPPRPAVEFKPVAPAPGE